MKEIRRIEVHPSAPPIMGRILQHFPAVDVRRVIITYGGAIWVPGGFRPSRELFAHETVHIEQQDKVGTDAWWDRYFEDAEFRYEQELEAHKAELRAYTKRHGNSKQRVKYREQVAHRLSGEMYGSVRTYREATNDLIGVPSMRLQA